MTQITPITEPKMAEILLKCEVPGCSFLTPRLIPRFYGEMVEHLKVPTSFSTHLLKKFPPRCIISAVTVTMNQGMFPPTLHLQQVRSLGWRELRSATERRPRRYSTSTWTPKALSAYLFVLSPGACSRQTTSPTWSDTRRTNICIGSKMGKIMSRRPCV